MKGCEAVESNSRTILFGVVLGAAIGLIAAVLLNRRAEQAGRSTAITAGEGLQLGAMVFGVLRSLAGPSTTERG